MKAALATAALVMGIASASHAAIVNLDAVANASLNGATAVTLSLAAGTYNITPIIDQYTAFTRFSSVAGCDGSGGNCSQGYEHSYRVFDGTNTLLFGDGAASGGIGPISGGGYFDTAAKAFANAGPVLGAFTLASAGNVSFYIYDDYLGDNSGGISLNITGAGAPEPATWALMIGGFALAGAALRRRTLAA